ncbi:MAG: DUF481 domain-containing protein [Gammaproteobacteria bacterium]|nr:DUF481 domain-containing protein [Gammaproteobacteria bacterium]
MATMTSETNDTGGIMQHTNYSTHTKHTSTHLHTGLDFGWNEGKWGTAFTLHATGSWLNGNANSEEYFGSGRGHYLLTDRSYLWARAAYRYNRFNEYQYQANELVG